jgi:hypothetical protein
MKTTKLILSKSVSNNLYVAVEGEVNDWACYVGSIVDGFEEVKKYGYKIRESEARHLFPEFKHLTWRD